MVQECSFPYVFPQSCSCQGPQAVHDLAIARVSSILDYNSRSNSSVSGSQSYNAMLIYNCVALAELGLDTDTHN